MSGSAMNQLKILHPPEVSRMKVFENNIFMNLIGFSYDLPSWLVSDVVLQFSCSCGVRYDIDMASVKWFYVGQIVISNRLIGRISKKSYQERMKTISNPYRNHKNNGKLTKNLSLGWLCFIFLRPFIETISKLRQNDTRIESKPYQNHSRIISNRNLPEIGQKMLSRGCFASIS